MRLGIDMGGSKIIGVVIDSKGQVLKQVRLESPHKREEIVEALVHVINTLLPKGSKKVGIGIPGFASNGVVEFMPHLPELIGLNLKKELEKKTRTTITLENDANCFALAEHKLGAGKGTKDMVAITLGTGVGAGFILEGKLYRGFSGGAGEVGHTKRPHDGVMQKTEDVLSGPALLKEYERLSGKKHKDFKDIEPDPHLWKIIKNLEFQAGFLAGNLINLLNPEMIVFGGGVANIDFIEEAEKVARANALLHLSKACKVRKAKLGDEAGAVGAALL